MSRGAENDAADGQHPGKRNADLEEGESDGLLARQTLSGNTNQAVERDAMASRPKMKGKYAQLEEDPPGQEEGGHSRDGGENNEPSAVDVEPRHGCAVRVSQPQPEPEPELPVRAPVPTPDTNLHRHDETEHQILLMSELEEAQHEEHESAVEAQQRLETVLQEKREVEEHYLALSTAVQSISDTFKKQSEAAQLHHEAQIQSLRGAMETESSKAENEMEQLRASAAEELQQKLADLEQQHSAARALLSEQHTAAATIQAQRHRRVGRRDIRAVMKAQRRSVEPRMSPVACGPPPPIRPPATKVTKALALPENGVGARHVVSKGPMDDVTTVEREMGEPSAVGKQTAVAMAKGVKRDASAAGALALVKGSSMQAAGEGLGMADHGTQCIQRTDKIVPRRNRWPSVKEVLMLADNEKLLARQSAPRHVQRARARARSTSGPPPPMRPPAATVARALSLAEKDGRAVELPATVREEQRGQLRQQVQPEPEPQRPES